MKDRAILLVDDETDLLEMLQSIFERAGYTRILTAASGKAALKIWKEAKPSMIILDVMMPGMDGFEVCRRLGSSPDTAEIPVLMLTARGEEMDRVVGLSLGADDYVVKPFSVRELMLRVRAVLRRRKRPENGPVERHGIRLDPEAHRVISEGKEVALTATEFRLLEDLMRHAGAVRSREQLLDNVWGYTFEGYARTVDTHMRRLRSKLGESQKFLETVRGVGYRFNKEA